MAKQFSPHLFKNESIMRLITVTLTGADDATDLDKLWEISDEFPFVEWGILLSRNSSGRPRFPSVKWLSELAERHYVREAMAIQFSGHLCGGFVKELLMGDQKFISEIGDAAFACFDRVQINTHGQPHEYKPSRMIPALNSSDKSYIFQYDNVNRAVLETAVSEGIKAQALFDLSHGAGVLPDEWPVPVEGVYCGYAGGLSAENVEDQLQIISEKVGDTPFWIDMETKVRSNGDKLFDLGKCWEVLNKCEKFI
jgi:hypothetical protein